MKHILYFEQLNELIKNETFVRSELRKMFKEIQGSIEHLIKHDDFKFEINKRKCTININRIEETDLNKVLFILNKYKTKFLKNNLVMSYKDHKATGFNFKDEDSLDFVPNDDHYHTIIIYVKDVINKRIKPNKYVYHFSDPSNRESILENGLIAKHHKDSPMWNLDIDLEYPDAVFAVNSDDTWRNSMDIWQIDTTIAKNKWFEDLNFSDRPDMIMTFENVPKEAIELVKEG